MLAALLLAGLAGRCYLSLLSARPRPYLRLNRLLPLLLLCLNRFRLPLRLLLLRLPLSRLVLLRLRWPRLLLPLPPRRGRTM